MVGEYSYDLDGEVELEDVMEKVTCLLNWEFKGIQWNLSKLNACRHHWDYQKLFGIESVLLLYIVLGIYAVSIKEELARGVLLD